MSWKKLSSKVLAEHPRARLVEDSGKLPGGQIIEYLRFENQPDGVMIIPKDSDSKILLQKEYSYPLDDHLYQFPGGSIHANELVEEAAHRELAEEAQLSGSLKSIGTFYSDNRRSNRKIHVFVCTNLKPASAPSDIEEEFENFWFDEEEINRLIALNEISNYSLLAGWAMFQAGKD